MSIVADIKKDSTFSGDDKFPTYKIQMSDIVEKVCYSCPFSEFSDDSAQCPAGNLGDGEFCYDAELEAFICVEAVKHDLYGGE
jgi:hypothetical protein